jgi:succinoglycan biosynthesis transport protein ExoP
LNDEGLSGYVRAVQGVSNQDVVGSSPIDPKYYLRIVFRRKWLILAVFVVVVGSVAAWTIRQPKVYEAQASMIIDVAAPRFLDKDVQDVNADSYSNYWYNREYYETQHKVITSRAVSQRVVEKLGLASDATFLGLDKVPDEKRRAELMKGADAAGILMGKIKVTPVKDSRLVYIGIEDSEPNRAALLANEVAEAYIAENLSLKLKITENASQWLDDRRDSLEKSSKSSEMALYNFKKSADMLTVKLEDAQNMVSQRLIATNQALTDVRLKIAGLKAKADAIRAVQAKAKDEPDRWAEGLPAAADNDLVKQYKVRVANQQAECAEMRERYLEAHPKLVACVDKLKTVQADLRRELNNIIVAADADLTEAQVKEKNLVALFDATKAEAFEVNKKSIEFDQLKRESDNNQRLYDLVLKRLKDIELSGLLRTSNVRVLDAARPAYVPVRPNVRNSLLLAVVVGLLGGFGLAMLLEFLDASVTSQQQIEDEMGLPFLGFIPRIEEGGGADRDLHIHRSPKSSVAECCRAVRTNLLFMSPDKPLKTMLVTSSGPQEGKSTTVINLGIAMAQSGQRILLMDTDMRRPRLHKAFGVPNDVGVSSLVMGEGKIEDAVKSTEVPGLFVMPCGPIPPNPAELLHTKAFAELLAKLAEKYDRIVLDSPPVGAVADAAVLSTQVDGVVAVLKGGVTHKEMAKRAIRQLRDVKAKLFGAVLNDINLDDSKYGDYYYAYRRYGYYYGEKENKPAA